MLSYPVAVRYGLNITADSTTSAVTRDLVPWLR